MLVGIDLPFPTCHIKVVLREKYINGALKRKKNDQKMPTMTQTLVEGFWIERKKRLNKGID